MATWGTWSDASNGGHPTCRDQSCDICISPWVCQNDCYTCYTINIGVVVWDAKTVCNMPRFKQPKMYDKNLLEWMLILDGSHITKPPSKAVTSPVVSFLKALSVTNLWKRKVRFPTIQLRCPLRSSTAQPPSKVRMALSPKPFLKLRNPWIS